VNIGDERPRILDDDQAAIVDEYGIDKAIEGALMRWTETAALQRAAMHNQSQWSKLRPIVAKLRSRFEADVHAAQARHVERPTRKHKLALHRARERFQLVSGEHAPLDEELHIEHEALAPVVRSIDAALAKMTANETRLHRRGLLPWYRRRAGGAGYWKRRQGPVTLGHSLDGEWVPGQEDTSMATRADDIWFGRAGADPIIALTIMRSVMQSVLPPAVVKSRGQYEDQQINRVIELMRHDEVTLTMAEISELLEALGYPANKVTVQNLNSRARALRRRGKQQPVAKTARGKALGRPRDKGKR